MIWPATKIVQNFDDAALHYDRQASVQAVVAERLVTMVECALSPQSILDVGSGTGFVAHAATQRWPAAQITALDRAPEMLRQAQHKMPRLQVITGDANQTDLKPEFDIVFSSMMLHWLPNPYETLQRWQKALKPNGKLYAALLVEGSFQEWRDLCHKHGMEDGLWAMPAKTFARDLAVRSESAAVRIPYPSAHAFLKRLKDTGAATARMEHKPINTAAMRHLLRTAPKPFGITYQVLYLELSQGKV